MDEKQFEQRLRTFALLAVELFGRGGQFIADPKDYDKVRAAISAMDTTIKVFDELSPIEKSGLFFSALQTLGALGVMELSKTKGEKRVVAEMLSGLISMKIEEALRKVSGGPAIDTIKMCFASPVFDPSEMDKEGSTKAEILMTLAYKP